MYFSIVCIFSWRFLLQCLSCAYVSYFSSPPFFHSFFLLFVSQASNTTTPNGSLELCYDELQRAYRTPLFCITNPINILIPNKPSDLNSLNSNSTDNKMIRSLSQSTMIAQPITLKVRINPGDYNLSILASTTDSIQDFKHCVLETSQQVNTIDTYFILHIVISSFLS